MTTEGVHKVFAYGMLIDPEVRDMVIGPDIDDPKLGVPLPGYVVLQDHETSISTAFPRLVPMEKGCVIGTVLTVDDEQLKLLDAYVGVPTFYTRDKLCYCGGWLLPDRGTLPDAADRVFVYNAVTQEATKEEG